ERGGPAREHLRDALSDRGVEAARLHAAGYKADFSRTFRIDPLAGKKQFERISASHLRQANDGDDRRRDADTNFGEAEFHLRVRYRDITGRGETYPATQAMAGYSADDGLPGVLYRGDKAGQVIAGLFGRVPVAGQVRSRGECRARVRE